MPTPNFQVAARHTDRHHRPWVKLISFDGARHEINVPLFACLHDENRTSWNITPGAHVYVHPECIRFYTVQEVPNAHGS